MSVDRGGGAAGSGVVVDVVAVVFDDDDHTLACWDRSGSSGQQLDGDLLLVEVVDEVGGLAVDVALADPPAAVVLVAGAHLAHVAGPAVPVAHVVVVPPRLAQEAEDGAEERLASHGGGGWKKL